MVVCEARKGKGMSQKIRETDHGLVCWQRLKSDQLRTALDQTKGHISSILI